MPSETDTSKHVALGPIAGSLRAIRGSTREQRGMAVATLLTFVGVAFLGPALTRLTTPKTRTQRLRDEALYQAETLRRRARKSGARVRKRARRLGGGTAERYL